MFETTDYYIASEIAYRHDSVARDWEAANFHRARTSRPRRVTLPARRRDVRLHRRPTSRATVA
jgi:hypothetical protein